MLPKGATVNARGQMQTRENSFTGLYEGLAFAIVLVYMLIVVNFQSWTDPFIIITALPAALAGIVLDAVPHRHHAFGAGADRGHHVHGRGDREQYPRRQFCQRADEGRFRSR